MKKVLMLLFGFLSLNVYAVDDSIEVLEKLSFSPDVFLPAPTIARDIKVGQKTYLVNYILDNLNDEAKQFLSGNQDYQNHVRSVKYDEETSQIISQLQEYFSLNPTGIIDIQTWNVLMKKETGWKSKVLSDSVQELRAVRLKQLQKNSSKYIVVNLPNMTAYAYDYDSATQVSTLNVSSKVVVGKPSTKTPIQDFQIWGVKYNPDWTPTPNMIKRSVIKNGNVDIKWLKSHGITVTDEFGKKVEYSDINPSLKYRYKQPSGDGNALGFLKFETTSRENIYLHDTNERYLFKNNLRSYSSGCVRVEDFMDLAQFVLNKDTQAIQDKIDTEQMKTERVEQGIPVYFTYALAMPISHGYPAYYTDIYSKTSLYINKY